MPVFKFRSVAEMPRVERVHGKNLEARIRAVWTRAHLLAPPDFEKGVQRFRTIEEANESRTRRVIERMRRTRGQQG